ncbi:MAG: hypothetical protein JJ979_02555 [Roseibium sp.]|nr:hypothetical protein [Roseibium sp.]
MKTAIVSSSTVQTVGKGRLDAAFYVRLAEHAQETTGSADIRSETHAQSVLDNLTSQTAQNIKDASEKRLKARQLQAEARELEKDAELLGMK